MIELKNKKMKKKKDEFVQIPLLATVEYDASEWVCKPENLLRKDLDGTAFLRGNKGFEKLPKPLQNEYIRFLKKVLNFGLQQLCHEPELFIAFAYTHQSYMSKKFMVINIASEILFTLNESYDSEGPLPSELIVYNKDDKKIVFTECVDEIVQINRLLLSDNKLAMFARFGTALNDGEIEIWL